MNPSDLQKLLQAQFSSTKVLEYITKAAVKAMTDVITEQATSRELFEALVQKKSRIKRSQAKLGKAQVLSIEIIEERRRVFAEKQSIKREKLFMKESQYLTAIQSCIFDDEIPSSPQRSPRKSPIKTRSTQRIIASVPSIIPSFSIDLTSTLAAVSTVARDLEETAPKSSVKASNSAAIVPSTASITTRSGRIVKRRGSQ